MMKSKIDSVIWAIFFIWIGIAILASVPWDWFLLGVSVLILVSEFVRWRMSKTFEGFWVACGVVLLAGGLWSLLNLPWPLTPFLFILLGVVLLARTVIGFRP